MRRDLSKYLHYSHIRDAIMLGEYGLFCIVRNQHERTSTYVVATSKFEYFFQDEKSAPGMFSPTERELLVRSRCHHCY